MNPFTEHPQRQGITYIEHWYFAMGIAYRLLTSVVAFALHAILPRIPITSRLDLEATTGYLLERNRCIESVKSTAHGQGQPDFTCLRKARDSMTSYNPTVIRRNAYASEA